jgi:hypothetical protein
VASDCGWSADRDSYGNNISNNAQTTFNTVHPVNTGADPLVYDLDGCPDAAFVTAKFWTNATPDGCAWNDTMTYRQEVSNYYSYDDGTAEAGYSIGEGAGSKIAYRFDTQGADSLRALRLYFDPIFTYDGPPNNPADGGFIITVWSSLAPEADHLPERFLQQPALPPGRTGPFRGISLGQHHRRERHVLCGLGADQRRGTAVGPGPQPGQPRHDVLQPGAGLEQLLPTRLLDDPPRGGGPGGSLRRCG